MINVEIRPFGREIMAMVFGVAKYKSMVYQKNAQIIAQQKETIRKHEEEQNMWEDISFNMTTKLIDKRYKSSKEFIASGGAKRDSLNYKTTITEDDKRFKYIAEQNMLKSRAKYNTVVSSYNKSIADRKVKATFKLNDLKKII